MRAFFVTGTDTEVGKTFISQALLCKLQQQRHPAIGFKPIAAGATNTPDGLRNEDGLALQQASAIDLDYGLINPVTYALPVAPHLAAAELGEGIAMDKVDTVYTELLAKPADILLVEGAGGWRLPLGQGQFLSDWVVEKRLPVILVVGVRLGCLNHARLTFEAIQADGLPVAGWVANQLEPQMPMLAENLQSLTELIPAPLLGAVPKVATPEQAATYLDTTPLMQELG